MKGREGREERGRRKERKEGGEKWERVDERVRGRGEKMRREVEQ